MNKKNSSGLIAAILAVLFIVAGFADALLPLVFILVIIATIAISVSKNPDLKNAIQKNKGTMSSDGHIVPADQDLTCENEYGHNHGKSLPERYVVHEDDDLGDRWIILNGKKISLKEAAKY